MVGCAFYFPAADNLGARVAYKLYCPRWACKTSFMDGIERDRCIAEFNEKISQMQENIDLKKKCEELQAMVIDERSRREARHQAVAWCLKAKIIGKNPFSVEDLISDAGKISNFVLFGYSTPGAEYEIERRDYLLDSIMHEKMDEMGVVRALDGRVLSGIERFQMNPRVYVAK